MGSLADVTLGDIGRALARYRPVVITVAIILVVLAVLPGPRRAELSPLSSVPPPASAPSSDAAAEGTTATDTTLAPDPAASDTGTFDSSFSSSSSSTFDSASPSAGSDFSSDDSSSSGFGTPSPTSDFSSDDFSSSSTTAPARPLTIVAAGWASATGATPLGSTGVPEGTLPVGKRIGQVDKYSYVRLAGDEKVLSLRVNPDGGRTTTGATGVSICQITEGGWEEAENVPADAAPAYDTTTCVPGDPGDGTAWTFNLLTFASPTDPRGFALVPTGDSIDYQVAFERS